MKGLLNKEQPAFPISEEQTDRIDDGIKSYSGLTKREYFALHLMQGQLSNSAESDTTIAHMLKVLELPANTEYDYKTHYPMYYARVSTQFADALLVELEKTEPK